jgi:hypothetical protein
MGGIRSPRLHRLDIRTLADLASGLAWAGADGDDVVLVLPAGSGALVLGSDKELIEAGQAFQGAICLAALPVPLSSADVAAKMADAVARSAGWRPVRVHPHPHALLGPATAVAALAGDLAGTAPGSSQTGDADVMTTAVLEGSHHLVLDLAGQVFHALDATGTDAIALAGRVHVGGERPLVVLDIQGAEGTDHNSLRRLQVELAQPTGRDLARLLRYDDAIDPYPNVQVPAREILVTPFWTREFCATVIRAAELAGRWESPDQGPTPRAQVALHTLSPRLLSLAEQDLRVRIWPLLANHWPQLTAVTLQDATIVRCDAGEANLLAAGRQTDAQITGLVRLNEGYHSGAHFFPRQAWDDRRVPIGSVIVWPAALTHPHRAESVNRGVRYTLNLAWHLGSDEVRGASRG